MKKILIAVFMVVATTAFAQMSGSIDLGYAPIYRSGIIDNSMDYIYNGEDASQAVFDDMFYANIDLQYELFIFTAYGWVDTYMLKGEGINFVPFYTNYGVGLEVEIIDGFVFYYEHACGHPVYTESYDGRYLRDSYDKIGLKVEF
jgi:hypothetical protein